MTEKKYDRNELLKKSLNISQEDQLKAIGRAIRMRREEMGMTSTALASLVTARGGTTVRNTQVEGVERGEILYRIDMILKMCAVLGVELTITNNTSSVL